MRVLVTGSEGGIGKAVVSALLRDGQMVWRYDPWAGIVENPFSQRGEPIERLMDAVVVCHGVNEPSKPYKNDNVWEANVWSVIDFAKRFVKFNQERSGRKVFIAVTSNSADIPRSKSLDYCSGKAAVDMALRVMQRDHAADGFEFHSVAAGHVRTPMFERMSEMLGADVMKAGYMRSPLKRLIEPEELAQVIKFLVTNPAAVWLSGNTLRVDGGEH